MYKIAIVDDEVDILNLLERYLKRNTNFDITTFNKPQVAYEEILQGKYDLVLCDIMMPYLNGLELLKHLSENENKTKIIMMTAYDDLEKTFEAHKYGAKMYLKKPFKSLQYVEEQILEILGN